MNLRIFDIVADITKVDFHRGRGCTHYERKLPSSSLKRLV